MSTTYRYPFPFDPAGWYQVAWSGEVGPGEVAPLRYFGRDLVLFRTRRGEAVVLDAHCPHLGAHLGFGGRVEEDSIVCPFHGWRYARDGRCIDARLYERATPPDAALRSWPLREVSGLIMVYYDPEGAAPAFELPTVAEHGAPGWIGYQTYRYTARMHVQELAENVPDAVHFNSVHGLGANPTIEHALEGPIYRQIATLPEGGGPVGVLRQAAFGLGLILLHADGALPQVQVVAATPIDEEHVDFRASLLFYEGEGARELSEAGRKMADLLDGQFKSDIRIWENKVYPDSPMLLEEDGARGALRRWARQFYPHAAGAGQEAVSAKPS